MNKRFNFLSNREEQLVSYKQAVDEIYFKIAYHRLVKGKLPSLIHLPNCTCGAHPYHRNDMCGT